MDSSAARASFFSDIRPSLVGRSWLAVLAVTCSLGLAHLPAAADTSNDDNSNSNGNSSGPVRLNDASQSNNATARQSATGDDSGGMRRAQIGRYAPGEFELYVNKLLGLDVSGDRNVPDSTAKPDQQTPSEPLVRRLGADLMLDSMSNGQAEGPRQVGEDYLVGIGDEVQVTLWGSVDADLRLVVDRLGRINIPRVGPIMVAGTHYGELNDVVRSRVAQVFKNFQVSTALGRLRSFRIYVTGFTQRPGAYTVSSLSTIVNGLMQAGGPSAAGSFRNIELRRNGKTMAHFDAYDLLLRGNKAADLPLQAEDVLYIGPVGPQAAILGSVNKATIVELMPNETVSDVLAMAGGFSAVADRTRISIERLSQRNEQRVAQLELPAQASAIVGNGDVLHAFSAVDSVLAQDRQYKRIHIEGEVFRPGDYLLPPASTLGDAIRAAGGLTPQAYVFGADFTRESVRKTQQENYDRALRDMEVDFARSSSTKHTSTADEAAAQTQQAASTTVLIERLRSVHPTGRIVLQLQPDTATLPPLAIENGDNLLIPSRPNTVGVFGSVFNAGSYLLSNGSTLDDVMKMAGGPKRGADVGDTFVLRANGSVVSARQSSSGWLSMGSGINNLRALPGDTVFVPEELDRSTFIQSAKDWTQILANFGLGLAAVHTLVN